VCRCEWDRGLYSSVLGASKTNALLNMSMKNEFRINDISNLISLDIWALVSLGFCCFWEGDAREVEDEGTREGAGFGIGVGLKVRMTTI
jgi:hypothetical protein